MGMATILQARAIVLLATGRSKAACVERLVNGPITTTLPASFLQLHPDVEVVSTRRRRGSCCWIRTSGRTGRLRQ